MLTRLVDEGYIIPNDLQSTILRPFIAQRSERWFELRKLAITGSIVDTVIGNNKYQTYDDLVMEKAGKPTTFKGNAATKWGTELEPKAIAEFEEAMKCKVIEMGLTLHPSYQYLAHSPDGIAVFKDRPPALIEVKCPLYRNITAGLVPAYYMGQVMLGLSVFNVDECFFIQYKPTPHTLDITVIHNEALWLEKHLCTFQDFWKDVAHWREIGYTKHPKFKESKSGEKRKNEYAEKLLIVDIDADQTI